MNPLGKYAGACEWSLRSERLRERLEDHRSLRSERLRERLEGGGRTHRPFDTAASGRLRERKELEPCRRAAAAPGPLSLSALAP